MWLLDRVRADNLTDRQRNRLDRQSVENQLGWLDEYRDTLEILTEMAALGRQACSVVRRDGYSVGTTVTLKQTLGMGKAAVAQEMIDELVTVVAKQCSRCDGQPNRLPGSSEVIESLIGKGKRLLGTSQNNNSLTGQILSIAASTKELTVNTVREAMGRCRIKDLRAWVKKNIS